MNGYDSNYHTQPIAVALIPLLVHPRVRFRPDPCGGRHTHRPSYSERRDVWTFRYGRGRSGFLDVIRSGGRRGPQVLTNTLTRLAQYLMALGAAAAFATSCVCLVKQGYRTVMFKPYSGWRSVCAGRECSCASHGSNCRRCSTCERCRTRSTR